MSLQIWRFLLAMLSNIFNVSSGVIKLKLIKQYALKMLYRVPLLTDITLAVQTNRLPKNSAAYITAHLLTRRLKN